jgi:hypothetical protein
VRSTELVWDNASKRFRVLTAAELAWDDAVIATPASPFQRLIRKISWPLTAILASQIAFSLSLVWSNTAFGDEALYLWQGRLEWAHWLHSAPLPPNFNRDSGALQIYPLLGSAASAVGGLAAARILSLCLMLLTTVLLYLIGARVFGARTAVLGSALWALSEPVLRLAFATYDPLACMLMVLSMWLAVQAAVRLKRGELIALSALALALGIVTAVAFAIYLPLTVLSAFLVWQTMIGIRGAIWCAAWLGVAAIILTIGFMTFLHLWANAIGSTVTRTYGLGHGISAVASTAWSLDGLLLAVACAGVILAFAVNDSRRFALASFVLAGVAVPVYQAYIGTAFSMDKHMSAGSGLMALAGGYAFSRVGLSAVSRTAAAALTVAIVAFPGITGLWYARSTFHSWPSIQRLLPAVQASSGKAPIYVTGSSGSFGVTLFEYYLMSGADWQHWDGTAVLGKDSPSSISNIRAGRYSAIVTDVNAARLEYPGLLEKAVRYNNALASEIFQLEQDGAVLAVLKRSKLYRIYRVIPYRTTDNTDSSGLFVVWQRVRNTG